MFIEAFCLSALARLAMITLSFRSFKKFLGKYSNSTTNEASVKDYEKMGYIRWAVSSMSRYTPWESKCLVQAIVMKWMLNKRNVESNLHLGIGRDPKKGLVAHAWLSSGGMVVIGENMESNFKEVATFQ